MKTEDKDWGRVYPNVITWITTGKVMREGQTSEDVPDSEIYTYHMLSWVRFWREGNEYQLPVRMSADGVASLEEGSRYDEQFHKRCLDIIRFGRAHGDFKEPIKLNDKHVITISYDDIDKE